MSRRRLVICASIPSLLFAAVWVGSYWLIIGGAYKGYGGFFDRGGIYFAGPSAIGLETRAIMVAFAGLSLEDVYNARVQRWKPVRYLSGQFWGPVTIVAAWVPVPLLAIAPAVIIRRGRRRRKRERGFDVI
jgi:hypothetical protein